MYGTLRVVLSRKMVTPSGKKVVSVTGEGSNHPVGFWYRRDGKLYVDLKSADQLYQRVNSETIALKGMGPRDTEEALRDFVMDYWHRTKAMRAA